ncbi:MAG: hypothetical protein RLO81_19935 [Fulvivirga sp.]|uniref:TolB family protein n=1 Tax=Fulvivirga sp. TaxID=1931237 RepID=UPI0032EF28CA
MISSIRLLFAIIMTFNIYCPLFGQSECNIKLTNILELPELQGCQYPMWNKDGRDVHCSNVYNPENSNDDLIVFLDKTSLKVMARQGDSSWLVTSDNQKYYFPIISNDKNKVVVHNGSKMQVFNVNGSGLISELGWGVACSWNSGSDKILFIRDESPDGHVITGSEIYMINADGSNLCKLTNTPNTTELWAHWSADGERIVFYDEQTDKVYQSEIAQR